MPAQPVALMPPVRAVALDERPEPTRVVWDAQVAELVHDHVVEHLERRQREPPVEGERAACGARAPDRPLPTDADPLVGDPDPRGLLVGQHRDEFAGA